MTNTELKEALKNGRPVVARLPKQGELEYSCVSAIILRRGMIDNFDVSAELLDKNGNSVTVVNPKYLRYKEVKE